MGEADELEVDRVFPEYLVKEENDEADLVAAGQDGRTLVHIMSS
jgi:hypothetical protein